MDKIPTWEELQQSGQFDDYGLMARHYTQLHVTAALNAANKSAKVIMISNCNDHTPFWGACVTCGRMDNPEIPTENIDEESILNAYPLNNIQ